ncbi:hypothetical protein [Azotobacter salinestris]|uniref:hypothetical protein n=1 Tax=Azotobacter salinestris TaxID=69964 RepID=UPI0012669557|nr:hypothetical protein [Azotobacter salinestris]
MDETKLRAEFESWVYRTVVDVTPTDLERDGEIYEWDKLNMAFAAWKASREALVIELPPREDMKYHISGTPAWDKCRTAIHAAGIRTR